MPRNIRNEIYIAVAAIVIIGFALAFAVLLSGTTGNNVDEGGTVVAEATASVTESRDTNTAPASEVPSKIATSTQTASPQDTEPSTRTQLQATANAFASETSSNLSESPLETEDNTFPIDAIRRSSATPSVSEQPTATNVSVSTSAELPTNTPRPGATRIAQARATDTARPTATDTPQPSPTATATPAPTYTLEPSPIALHVASGIIPTPPPSPTVQPPYEPTRTPTNCERPQGWTTYVVRPGNTLFAIALATNSTLDELRQVNCIPNIDNIAAGDLLFVPHAPSVPVATLPLAAGRAGLASLGCSNFRTQITSPVSTQRLRNTFSVYGSAFRDDFWYYKIEIRPDWADVYNFYSRSDTPVMNGVLAEVNSEIFGEGLHWIRLSVVDLSANIQPDAICEIPVIFE